MRDVVVSVAVAVMILTFVHENADCVFRSAGDLGQNQQEIAPPAKGALAPRVKLFGN